jgi:hypothetical protein
LARMVTIQDSDMDTRDGRHAPSHRTRDSVAEAMFDCLEDGDFRPCRIQSS